jgi:hypothetical protein
MNTGPIYFGFAIVNVALGILLMSAPRNWYGPSWSYFSQLPHNGFGMGMCCAGIGILQIIALRLNAPASILSILLFLAGFVYWTAGIILGAEGLLGHQGLMETPFMMLIGAHKLILSASLWAHHRRAAASE